MTRGRWVVPVLVGVLGLGVVASIGLGAYQTWLGAVATRETIAEAAAAGELGAEDDDSSRGVGHPGPHGSASGWAGHGPFGYGGRPFFFFPFGGLLVMVLVIALLARGRHGWGPPPWAGDPHGGFDDWHRRAHGDGGDTTGGTPTG